MSLKSEDKEFYKYDEHHRFAAMYPLLARQIFEDYGAGKGSDDPRNDWKKGTRISDALRKPVSITPDSLRMTPASGSKSSRAQAPPEDKTRHE